MTYKNEEERKAGYKSKRQEMLQRPKHRETALRYKRKYLAENPQHREYNATFKQGNYNYYYLLKQYRVFEKMKKNTPVLKEWEDKVLLSMLEEWGDPKTPKARKEELEPLLLKYTSRPKSQAHEHKVEVSHNRTLIDSKIDELLLVDNSDVVSEQ